MIEIIDAQPASKHAFAFEFLGETDVEATLKEFNPKKATGWDSLPPNALRCGATELATPLTRSLALRLEERRVGASFQER